MQEDRKTMRELEENLVLKSQLNELRMELEVRMCSLEFSLHQCNDMLANKWNFWITLYFVTTKLHSYAKILVTLSIRMDA